MNESLKLQKSLMMTAIECLLIFEASNNHDTRQRAINCYAETMATLASLIVPENQQS